jgi:hypothetical protein
MSTPEVFPRNDGTTYVCAISSETPLPVDPAEVAPDPGAIERLEDICRRLSPVLAVNAGEKLHRRVGAKIHHGDGKKAPDIGGLLAFAFSIRGSCLVRSVWRRPA